jgi:hypothetical protein
MHVECPIRLLSFSLFHITPTIFGNRLQHSHLCLPLRSESLPLMSPLRPPFSWRSRFDCFRPWTLEAVICTRPWMQLSVQLCKEGLDRNNILTAITITIESAASSDSSTVISNLKAQYPALHTVCISGISSEWFVFINTFHINTCWNRRVSALKYIRNNEKFKSSLYTTSEDFLYICGLVVRVLGYRSGALGSIPGTTRKKGKWVWNGAHSASWVQLRSSW